jgi:LacI family transcriptional regulator
LARNLLGHDRPLEHDLVCGADFVGGATCTRHLIEQGRRRIAAVVASACSSHDARVGGYYHALRVASAAGVPVAAPHVLEIPEGLAKKEADHWVADQVVRHNADGVFCYQDSLAVGLIMDLFSRGRSVPKDVAVVGYDNLPIGNLFNLGVTTYHYPAERLVRHAIRLLRQRLTDPTEPPVKVCVPGELIVRNSSRVPEAAPAERNGNGVRADARPTNGHRRTKNGR